MKKLLFDANFKNDELSRLINSAIFRACKRIAPNFLFDGVCNEKFEDEFSDNVINYSINFLGFDNLWQHIVPSVAARMNKYVPFYFPSGNIPNLMPEETPIISMMYDVLPIVAPKYMPSGETIKQYKRQVQTDINRSDLIFVPSEYTKQKLMENFMFANEPVVLNPASLIADEYIELPMARNNEKYFYIDGSTADPDALNEMLKIFIYEYMKNKNSIKLYISGELKLVTRELLINLQVARKIGVIREYKNLSSGQRAALLRGAIAAILFFNIDVLPFVHLDAMKCSCPIVTNHMPMVDDFCADAVLYMDKSNISHYKELFDTLLNNDDLRNMYIYKGLQREKPYNWDNSANVFVENISKLY